MYWYPEAVQVPHFDIYNGGATALFDADGNALPALEAFAAPEPSSCVAMAAIMALGFGRRPRCRKLKD
jgi:hypothetical protein